MVFGNETLCFSWLWVLLVVFVILCFELSWDAMNHEHCGCADLQASPSGLGGVNRRCDQSCATADENVWQEINMIKGWPWVAKWLNSNYLEHHKVARSGPIGKSIPAKSFLSCTAASEDIHGKISLAGGEARPLHATWLIMEISRGLVSRG